MVLAKFSFSKHSIYSDIFKVTFFITFNLRIQINIITELKQITVEFEYSNLLEI